MNWYYAKNGTQIGPMSEPEFRAHIQSGEVGPETYVWQPQLDNWKRAREVPGLIAPAFSFDPPRLAAPLELTGTGLGKAVIGLLFAGAGLDVISFVTGLAADPNSEYASDASIGLNIVQVLLYWTTAGFFAAWAYRANRNLRLFGVRNLEYTPGWAAGAFFVPFLNLVRPFKVFREIWKASDPSAIPDHWKVARTSPLIVAWWTAFVAMGLLGQLALRLSMSVDPRDLAGLFLFNDLVSITASILAILVVRGILNMQRAKAMLPGQGI